MAVVNILRTYYSVLPCKDYGIQNNFHTSVALNKVRILSVITPVVQLSGTFRGGLKQSTIARVHKKKNKLDL